MREIIDIDWSIVKERLEDAIKKQNKIDTTDYVDRMTDLTVLSSRLENGERSQDLYNEIMALEL